MINPILGEPHALVIEPGAIVLDTRAGRLVMTRDGVRGLVPKGLRFVGVIASGEVLAENADHAPLLAPTVDAFVAGKLTPVAGVERIFDAAGTHVVALRDGKLVRSDDAGKSFIELPVKGSVDRAFVRADGVVLAGITGAAPAATWFTVSSKGQVAQVHRTLRQPMRWGGFIMADFKRNTMDEAESAQVLMRDGRTFARVDLPREVQGAEYISFHPVFLGAPTEKTRAWEGDRLALAPLSPAAKKQRSSGPEEYVTMMEAPDGVTGGVVGGIAGGPGRRSEPLCKGLRCIAKLRPILPDRPGSRVVARFFDDGLCKGPVNGACEKGPLMRAPTIGFFDRGTGILTFRPTPPACEPSELESLRGLVILDCRGDRYASDAAGAFVREGPVDDAMKGSWDYDIAEDGTLLVERVDTGRIVAASVRLPVAPGAGGAWRTVTKPGAVAHAVLAGGAVLIAVSNEAGDRLALSLDAPEGVTELVASVSVTRAVRRIVVKSGYPELAFADDAAPRAARISRGGELIAVPH
jgi:hypothetical protein